MSKEEKLLRDENGNILIEVYFSDEEYEVLEICGKLTGKTVQEIVDDTVRKIIDEYGENEVSNNGRN